jgi:multidrug efflux system membrane fusion protein
VRKVTVALQVGDEVGISAGLSAGEIVIVEGQGALSNGAKVTVAPPDAKATPSAGATPIPGAKASNSRKSGTTAAP